MSSGPSYTKIDYSLRPAKAIERKMIVDMLRRLDRFVALKHYRYIGLGSPYFSDFNLVHKALGINDMVSIERESADADRFRFNVPYGAVELRFGESADVLPELDWSQRSIVWLDYDDGLNESMLSDISYVARELQPGSVLLVSANVRPLDDLESRAEKTREQFGPRLPRHYTGESLGSWGTAAAARDVIDEEISVAVSERNIGRKEAMTIAYRQLFNFNYRDGVHMLTVGGILSDPGIDAHVTGCAFGEFDFCKTDADAYRINVPKLTVKETRYLDSLLPRESFAGIDIVGLPPADVDKYARIYRYFPKFADVDL